MAQVVLGIGSNCGNRLENVANTLRWLSDILGDFKFSKIYETPAVGKTSNPYLNAVCIGQFGGKIEVLNKILKTKEIDMGRNEECRMRGDVPIDIDIVMADEEIIKEWDYNQKFFRMGYKEITS